MGQFPSIMCITFISQEARPMDWEIVVFQKLSTIKTNDGFTKSACDIKCHKSDRHPVPYKSDRLNIFSIVELQTSLIYYF